MNWIKVEAGLPEDEIDILISDGLNVTTGYYSLDAEVFIEKGMPLMFKVTHWTKIEPPKN